MIRFAAAPIVAAAFTTEAHHRACVELFAGLRLANRRLLLPATVAAEAGYLIDQLGGAEREMGFLQGIAAGDFEPVNLTLDDYRRMAELTEQYADMRLGTTDASVIALAERLGVTEVATLDRRHFPAVRPRHVAAFTLLMGCGCDVGSLLARARRGAPRAGLRATMPSWTASLNSCDNRVCSA